MDDIEETLTNDHSLRFDFADELDRTARMLLIKLNECQIKLFDLKPHQRIFLFILTRSLKSFSSILILCRQGFGQDVAPMLRSLMENLVTARYILCDAATADEKTKRFVAYKWIIFKRHLPEQEKQLLYVSPAERVEFFQRKKSILTHVDTFKKDFGVTSDRALLTWSGKTVRDMARSVNKELLDEYETTFRLCSRFSHPSILGDNEYIIQDAQYLTFSLKPSSVGVITSLDHSCRYILGFIATTNALFGFNIQPKVEQLKAKHLKAFPREEQSTTIPSAENKAPRKGNIRESTIKFEI